MRCKFLKLRGMKVGKQEFKGGKKGILKRSENILQVTRAVRLRGSNEKQDNIKFSLTNY